MDTEIETLIYSCRIDLYNKVRSDTQLVSGRIRMAGSRDLCVYPLTYGAYLKLLSQNCEKGGKYVYLLVLKIKCLLPHQAENMSLNEDVDLKELLCFLAMCVGVGRGEGSQRKRMIPVLTLRPLLNFTQGVVNDTKILFF